MPHRVRSRRTILAFAAACAAGCGADPVSPRAVPIPARGPIAWAGLPSGAYVIAQEDGGVTWSLDAATGVVRSSADETVELSPELAAYFANIAAAGRAVEEDDAAIADAIAAHRRGSGCRPPARVCADDARYDAGIANTVVPLRIEDEPDEPVPPGGPGAPGDYVPFEAYVPDPPPPPPGFLPGPALTLSGGLDLSTSGPGQTCRDIARAWGRQQAGYDAARTTYRHALGEMFLQTAGMLGAYRFNPPAGEGRFPDPVHPSTESVREYLKSFKDVAELRNYLFTRYGPYASGAAFDLSAANYMSAMTQRGIYATLFNVNDCQNAVWHPEEPRAGGGSDGGGAGGSAPRQPRVCYYLMSYLNGRLISQRLLFCE